MSERLARVLKPYGYEWLDRTTRRVVLEAPRSRGSAAAVRRPCCRRQCHRLAPKTILQGCFGVERNHSGVRRRDRAQRFYSNVLVAAMTKKATKQSRATKRRKARQRLQAERAALVARAKSCGMRHPELRSNEQLAHFIAWRRPGDGRPARSTVPTIDVRAFVAELEREHNDSRNA
jgi:hypothetical protein